MTAQFTTLLSFNGANGNDVEAGLTVDANGNLFGTTYGGSGTVFEMKNTGTVAAPGYASGLTTLVTNGGPHAGLIADANGDLFGTTYLGGANGYGTVFEIKNTGTVAAPFYSNTPTTLVTFNGSNGANPYAGLTADANGDLFGTTTHGGANSDGTVFEIKNTGTVAAPVYASAPTTLVSFNGSNGAEPVGGLITDANGDLFGTTVVGGANGDGTVFEIKNTGTDSAPVYASTPTTLVSFNGPNGVYLDGGLIADANGDLFGTTYRGGANGYGTVFEIRNTGTIATPVYSNIPTTLVSFNGSNGDGPDAGLIIDANGDLFGTTEEGGANGAGTVFEIKNNSTVAAPVYANATTVLVSFNVSNGDQPDAGLTADANGDLFGTTSNGGANFPNGYGTVFEITGAGFVAAAHPTIAGTVSGQTTTSEAPVTPFAGVTIGDSNAGVTDMLTITLGGAGGTLVDGTGFNSLTPAGTGVYVLSGTASAITTELDALVFTPKEGAPNASSTTTFTLSDQSSAGGAPVVDTTTTVIDNDPSLAGQFTTLFDFNGSNGAYSFAGLTRDANGDLFGATFEGGANDYGAGFEIQNTGTIAAPVYASASTTLSFDGSNGAPPAGLIADANGDLFGTSEYYGANDDGTVFEIKNTGTVTAPVYSNTPTTLVSFNGSNGANPYAGLTADAKAALFGTTEQGGANSDGTVFEIKNTGTVAAPVYASAPTTLVSFNGSNGANPDGGLTADANGDLFGTTSAGGANNYGTVFEIKNAGAAAAPVYASVPTTLLNFNGSNGQDPEAGLIVDAMGDLFGTTELGGANGVGTVFEIKNTGTVTVPTYTGTPATLVSFNGLTDGDYPTAALILDSNGDLFGTTEGGATGNGTVFEIKNTGTVATPIYASAPITLVNFNGSNGAYPYAVLTADANGDLFGTTLQGGSAGDGTVFEITGVFLLAPAVAPTIAGTVSGQTTTSETPVRPFAHVTIGDANAGATDTLTITLGGAGGTLSGTGLSGGVGGVYTLSGTASAITTELDALVFTPKAGAPYTSSTTTFTLSDLSSAGGAPIVDSTTSVIDSDPAVAPTISGTGSDLTTTSETPVRPFAHATVGDNNVGATDMLTITLGGAGGTLSGTGLSGGVGGVYTLSGTAAAITSELDALLFAPTAGAPNTSSTATFTLIDQSSAGGGSIVDSTTSVIDSAPAVAPTTSPLSVEDTTLNQALTPSIQAYTGPVAGLQQEYINTGADSLNITASTPNWFIHSGGGNDAIAVSGGTNVLDGGTGSNFLTGGSGTDTFFVDDRNAPADIWSTVNNFHAGDSATIWGVTPQDNTLDWADGQGAAGYTGLTLHAMAPGQPTASLTLVGFTQADLHDGRLSVSFGSSNGSSYMYVHDNS